jgi:transposase
MPSPATLITSPYDHEARYSTKRGESWVGYKVHLTESCDDDLPRLITNIETTPATTPDDNMIEVVHRSLDSRNLLPSEHLVDKGYTDATALVASQRDYGVEIIGPVAQDPNWQSRDKAGFDKSAFAIDWEAKVVTCPARKQSISWLPRINPASGVDFEARFSGRDCTPCSSRSQCTRSKQEPRIISLQTRDLHEALHTMRRRQTTEEFRKSYAPRAGIESTHAQAIRRSGLRRTHAIGVLSKPAYNMSSQPSQSTSCESHPGQTERRLPRRAAPTSRLSNYVPREFATCVTIYATRGKISFPRNPAVSAPRHGCFHCAPSETFGTGESRSGYRSKCAKAINLSPEWCIFGV